MSHQPAFSQQPQPEQAEPAKKQKAHVPHHGQPSSIASTSSASSSSSSSTAEGHRGAGGGLRHGEGKWERKGGTPLPGHQLPPKLESALVKQAASEFLAANTYLAASLWFAERDLQGFARYMLTESKEEMKHGYGMLEYIVKRRAHFQVREVPAPQMDFDSPDKVIAALYEFEVLTASAINDLVLLARKESDVATEIFLHAYVGEQIESCDLMHTMLGKVKEHLLTGGLLHSMDEHLQHCDGCAKCSK